MTAQDIAPFFPLITAAAAIFGAFIAQRVYKSVHLPRATQECDTQYIAIQRILLDQTDLHGFYGTMSCYRSWSSWQPDRQKMYLFLELQFLHIAFVYREWKSRRVSGEYWNNYEQWLQNLLLNEDFRIICDTENRIMEKDFRSVIEEAKFQIGMEPEKAASAPDRKRSSVTFLTCRKCGALLASLVGQRLDCGNVRSRVKHGDTASVVAVCPKRSCRALNTLSRLQSRNELDP